MSDKKKFEIHKVKDKFGVVRREHATLFPLPFKLLICGKKENIFFGAD